MSFSDPETHHQNVYDIPEKLLWAPKNTIYDPDHGIFVDILVGENGENSNSWAEQ